MPSPAAGRSVCFRAPATVARRYTETQPQLRVKKFRTKR
jgi:hypothetical protein